MTLFSKVQDRNGNVPSGGGISDPAGGLLIAHPNSPNKSHQNINFLSDKKIPII